MSNSKMLLLIAIIGFAIDTVGVINGASASLTTEITMLVCASAICRAIEKK